MLCEFLYFYLICLNLAKELVRTGLGEKKSLKVLDSCQEPDNAAVLINNDQKAIAGKKMVGEGECREG